MRKSRGTIVVVATLGVVLGGAALARAHAARSVASEAAGEVDLKADAKIEQGAVNALEDMGAYLRTLKSFQVKAEVTNEDVLLDGEKVQTANVADLVARTPDGLRLDVNSDLQERVFLYNGSSFTLFAPRSNYYATVPAPATINDLAMKLQSDYGIDLPFVDLFRWGTPAAKKGEITSATDIGPGEIDGVICEHYAFRQPGLDWQIWIQQGDFPLPRKLVITTTTDEARPQHVSLFTWNLAPAVESAAFDFTPPKDAKKIKFTEVRLKGQTAKTED